MASKEDDATMSTQQTSKRKEHGKGTLVVIGGAEDRTHEMTTLRADQLRITSELGGTPACDLIDALHARGGVIAGSSAGASVLGQVMPVSGAQDDSARVRDQLRLVPGLGLVRNVIFDQHFAQRGRMGRIIGAAAQNPSMLGIGIDEDTALVLDHHRHGSVIGSGAVTVADGRGVTHTNINEADAEHAMSVFDLRVHVLSAGDEFDLSTRRPAAPREDPSARVRHA
jgi:cyanophycinase